MNIEQDPQNQTKKTTAEPIEGFCNIQSFDLHSKLMLYMDLQGQESLKHALWRIVYNYTHILFLEDQEEEAKLEKL